mgnify:CR=1 FL=1
MGEKNSPESHNTHTQSIYEVTTDIIPPNDGRWYPHDCILPAIQESKTDSSGIYSETVPEHLLLWPHNPTRIIPFKRLNSAYPQWNFFGFRVYLINGFLTTLPNGKITGPSSPVPKTDQYDRSHLVTWDKLSTYNLNVYGAWRLNNIGTYYIDTEVVHFPFRPLPPPPTTEPPQLAVFQKDGVLQTRPWPDDKIEEDLGIREVFDVNYFRYSQYNRDAIGEWCAINDGSGGLYVDCTKRNNQYIGRDLVL